MRNADKVVAGNLDARALVAVVKQEVDALGDGLAVEFFGSLADTGRFWRVDGDDDQLEGSNGVGPDDSARIMVLLDGRGYDSRHTDAIAAHEGHHGFAGFVEHRGLHGF